MGNNNLEGCFPACMTSFCSVWYYLSFVRYQNFFAGNNLDASWYDFCYTSAGVCGEGNCESFISINEDTPFQNHYQSSGTISTNGNLSVEQNQETEYNATRVRLNEGFSAKAGADFKIRSSGCD